MGKVWDEDKGGRTQWVAWMTQVMKECLRVMKPGAHGLVWALPRTSHWTATALENAGFEVRDIITHLFGTGFPKSLDISKAIDKAAGAEREVIGVNPNHCGESQMQNAYTKGLGQNGSITAPATPEAKQWQGWGTALKPASEHWILVRKPCSEKTVAANVIKHGTGGINIDASRIKLAANEDVEKLNARSGGKRGFSSQYVAGQNDGALPPGCDLSKGRFPANLILDEESAAMLDEQSLAGGMHSAGKARKGGAKQANDGGLFGVGNHEGNGTRIGDSGGASRFFYCAKASKKDKNNGLEDCTTTHQMSEARPNSGDYTGKFPDHDHREKQGNFHPTVKSTELMTYLIKLITPPEGLVLDPFAGSGSTGVAAIREGFKFIGIEKEKEYFEILSKRLKNVE